MINLTSFAILIFLSFPMTTCQTSDSNIALDKSATQSGTYRGRDARRAVDGDPSSDLIEMRCSTADTSDPNYNGVKNYAWWQVDLDNTYTITSLTIFNTNDTEEYRYLSDFVVYVSASRDVSDGSNRLVCFRFNLYQDQPVPRNESVQLNCTSPRVGRFLTIMRQGGYNPTMMTICEVKVEGARYYSCDNCQSSSCSTSHGCDQCKPGFMPPSCISGCSPGFYGINCASKCPDCPVNGQICNQVTGQCPSCSDLGNCQNPTTSQSLKSTTLFPGQEVSSQKSGPTSAGINQAEIHGAIVMAAFGLILRIIQRTLFEEIGL